MTGRSRAVALAGRLAAAAALLVVAGGMAGAVALGAVPALAQAASSTTSTLAGQGGRGGRLNGPFVVVAIVGGLLLVWFQRRTFRRMEDAFDPDQDPDRDRPDPPDDPGR